MSEQFKKYQKQQLQQDSTESKTEEKTAVASPCVRNCCLDSRDICLGCFRHIDEIVGWQGRSDEEKRAILTRCQSRKLAR